MRADSVVKELVKALSADAGINERLMDHGRVHAHRLPAPPDDPLWAMLCVRQLRAAHGAREHVTGIGCFMIQTMAEVSETVPDPDLLLEAIQERVKTVLTGLQINHAYATTVVGVERYHHPTPAAYDGDRRCYWSTAEYLIFIE